jgi:hypothetical protein
MAPEIRAEHYTTDDRLLLIAAGDALIAWAVDLARHEANGTRWNRHVNDDPVLTAAQLGWLIATTTTTLRQTVAWYTDATLAARDRAIRDDTNRWGR